MKTEKIERITSLKIGDYPDTPVEVFLQRMQNTKKRMRDANLDFLVIFSDREHCTNQEFLVGVGPRFEESLLIISQEASAKILLGNECQYYAPNPDLGVEVVLFQDFSPAGQPRGQSKSLGLIMREAGIAEGQNVGCVGWKSYPDVNLSSGQECLDIPAFLADELRYITGNSGKVSNAVDIFTSTVDGLRIECSSLEIAQFEYAARIISNSVRATVDNFAVGKSERELEKHLESFGLPLTCHRMVSFGEKVRRGLSSPSDRTSKLGDSYTVAIGAVGALSARAGVIARDVNDLDKELQGFYPRFAFNYWNAVIKWYESLKVGELGGVVEAEVQKVIDKDLYTLMLNPGHNLHFEEWVGSIFTPENKETLYSGMVLQSDLIPISKGPFCYSNAEDGVVLADEELRVEIQNKYPEMWERINLRRIFLREKIGIVLHDSVLPISDTCGVYAPYALENDLVYVKN
jgi:hypothetical protein